MKSEIIFENQYIYLKTSKLLKRAITDILLEKDQVIVGLPGGRNIFPILSLLRFEPLSWEDIHIFMVDERLVPIASVESNFNVINRSFSVISEKINLHPFNYDDNYTDYGISHYKDEIKNLGGKYDIILLSSGEDGHIASLFPKHPSIFSDEEYYILVENSPKPPEKRMSITKNFLKKSNIAILLFSGEEKKKALQNFVNDKIKYTDCPAKLINEIPENYVLTNIDLKI